VAAGVVEDTEAEPQGNRDSRTRPHHVSTRQGCVPGHGHRRVVLVQEEVVLRSGAVLRAPRSRSGRLLPGRCSEQSAVAQLRQIRGGLDAADRRFDKTVEISAKPDVAWTADLLDAVDVPADDVNRFVESLRRAVPDAVRELMLRQDEPDHTVTPADRPYRFLGQQIALSALLETGPGIRGDDRERPGRIEAIK
jgi:hypothetical protein